MWPNLDYRYNLSLNSSCHYSYSIIYVYNHLLKLKKNISTLTKQVGLGVGPWTSNLTTPVQFTVN